MPGYLWAIQPKSKVYPWCLDCAFWFQCIASLSAVFPKSAQADFIDLRCSWATQPWELKSDVYHEAQVFWARYSSSPGLGSSSKAWWLQNILQTFVTWTVLGLRAWGAAGSRSQSLFYQSQPLYLTLSVAQCRGLLYSSCNLHVCRQGALSFGWWPGNHIAPGCTAASIWTKPCPGTMRMHI